MKRKLLVTASAVALFCTSHPVQAQTSSVLRVAPNEDEVIVTATRRSERLQDVPLSVTTYSQDELTEKGIVGYEGLAFETPGAIINRPTQNFNNFSVRGISTNGYGANLQGTVAIYIDELPISANGNSTILDPNLFDVERVEFLRGPQGTLFGSGSLAGAVRLLTKSPNLNSFDASALVDFGLTDSDSFRQRYNAMVNVPLVNDTLGVRVVAFYRNEEGYLDNIGTGIENSNTLVSWGGRAIMLWEPTDRLSVRLMALHEDSDPKDSSLTAPMLGRRKRVSDRPDSFAANLDSYNATISYQFNGAQFTSSSTYSKFDQSFVVDLAGTFGGAIAFALDAFAYDEIFVEEARLVSDSGGKFEWVVGGFFYTKRRDVDFNYRSSPEFLAASGITGLPDEYYQRFGNHTNSNELAGFGELTYRFSDTFWLTGGLRYGKTDVQTITEPGGYNSNYLTLALLGLSGPVTIVDIPAATGVKGKESGPSYKISASFKPSNSLTTYATVSTGFRTPVVNGFAGRVSLVDPTDIVIPDGASSDKLKNYEVGFKGAWFDNRLTGNFAFYLIDWSNIQVQANRVSDSVQFATNIGKARSKGFEFEIAARPTDGLHIGVNGSVNDSKVVKLTQAEAAISGAEEGIRLAFPRFQGSVYARYSFDVTQNVKGFMTVNAQHVGAFPGLFPNVPGNPSLINPTYAFTESYQNVNLSAGANIGEGLMVTAYIENLFDNHSITYVHPEAFIASRFGTLRPRTVGVRIGYDL